MKKILKKIGKGAVAVSKAAIQIALSGLGAFGGGN